MDFFEVIKNRRSIRRYTTKTVPPEVIEKALDAALLAPNSSNLQTWEFYWVQSADKKQKLVEACLSQSAARTAQELIVIVAAPSLWKTTRLELIKYLNGLPKVPTQVKIYYEKLIPFTYGWQILAPIKWLMMNTTGIFRPITRKPWNFLDIQEISIKSAALAAENFMLAITAQGFSTCPMEGIDELRIKKLLKLKCSSRVVMVISVGEASIDGTWGPQVRFDRNLFVKKV